MTEYRKDLPLATCALAYAEDYLGEGEVGGENRGPMVRFFLQLANCDPGQPWCAAYVNGVAEQAAALKNTRSPLEEVPQQALVQSYVNWAEEEGLLVSDPEEVALGDLFALNTGRTDRYDHVGFVRDPDPAGDRSEFATVEGNTSPEVSAGSAADREGELVASKTRSYGELDPVFIAWREAV